MTDNNTSERESPQVNIEEAVDLSDDWRDDGRATIDFFTNAACEIGRNRDDASEGVWLDRQEKRALYEAMRDYYDG